MNKQEKKERELVKPIFWFAMGMLFTCIVCIIMANKFSL